MSFTELTVNQLKTRLLTNGKSTWRLTRYSDQKFIAKNGFGKIHSFSSEFEVNSFWDYLTDKGYELVEPGRSLKTLKRVEPQEAVAA